jgi:hypothetical protein
LRLSHEKRRKRGSQNEREKDNGAAHTDWMLFV